MIIRGASTISASYKMELYLALVLTSKAKRLINSGVCFFVHFAETFGAHVHHEKICTM